jgi:nicotinate-nucleotide pyrophosphorylase
VGVIAPAIMDIRPNIKKPADPPYTMLDRMFEPVWGSIKKEVRPVIKLKNTIMKTEICVSGKVTRYLVRSVRFSDVDMIYSSMLKVKIFN